MGYELENPKHGNLINLTKEVMIQMEWTPDYAYWQVAKLLGILSELYGPMLNPHGEILPHRVNLVHQEVYRTIFKRPPPAAEE